MRNFTLGMILLTSVACGPSNNGPGVGSDVGDRDAGARDVGETTDGGADSTPDADAGQTDVGAGPVDMGAVDMGPVDMGPDMNAPHATVSISFPFVYVATFTDAIEVRGDADGAVAVAVNGVDATSDDGFSTWSATVPLEPWDNVVTAVAVNATGQETATSIDVRKEAPVERARSLVVDAARDRAWVLSREVIVEYDLGAGSRRVLLDYPELNGSTSTNLAYDEVNQLLYAARDSGALVEEIDIATGTILRSTTTPQGFVSIAHDGSDLYGVANGDNSIQRLDLTTGDRTTISGETVGSGPTIEGFADLFWDDDDGRFIIEQNDEIIAVDPASGDRTVLATFASISGARAWDSAADTLYDSRTALIAYDANGQTASEVLDYGGTRNGALAVTDGAVYLGLGNGLFRIELANPALEPVLDDRFPSGGMPVGGPIVPFDDEVWVGSSSIELASRAVTSLWDASVYGYAVTTDAIYMLERLGVLRRIDNAGTETILVADDHPQRNDLRGFSLAVDAASQVAYTSAFNSVSRYDIGTDTVSLVTDNSYAGPDLNGNFGLLFKGGTLYGLGATEILRIDPVTGEKVSVFSDPAFEDLERMGDFDADTIMVVDARGQGHALVFVDLTAGAVTRTIEVAPEVGSVGAPFYDPARSVVWLEPGGFIDLDSETYFRFVR